MQNTEKTRFDKNARQEMGFITEDNQARYELKFAVEEMPDEALTEFDRLSTTKVETEGDNQIFYSDDLEACDNFFNEKVLLIGGFDGELPEDWKDSFDLLERQAIVQSFLSASVFISEDAKLKKGFSFGRKTSEKIVQLKVNFNGEEIICDFIVPETSKKHFQRFRKITSGFVTRKGQTGAFLPNTFEKLGELYDEIGVSTESNPALHHKAIVMREIFGGQVEAETKKPNR